MRTFAYIAAAATGITIALAAMTVNSDAFKRGYNKGVIGKLATKEDKVAVLAMVQLCATQPRFQSTAECRSTADYLYLVRMW